MYSSREADIGILFRRSVGLCIDQTFRDKAGRILQAKITFMKQTVNLVNVYAPSGGSNVNKRKEFFNKFPELISVDCQNCFNLIGGDFNSVVDNILDTHPLRDYIDPSTKCLRDVTQTLGLTDIYRVFHTKSKGFTFHSPNGTRSRIDRFYVDCENQNKVLATGIEPFLHAPDHNAIVIDLSFGNVPRGRGPWKFNTTLLQDQTLKDDQISVILQYADDTTLTLYGFDSVRFCFNLISLYERATGARINTLKTEGLLCGSL